MSKTMNIDDVYNKVIELNSIYHSISKDNIIELLKSSEYYINGVYPNVDIESVKRDVIINGEDGRKYLIKNRSDGGRYWYCLDINR